jgi:hypothetical protein
MTDYLVVGLGLAGISFCEQLEAHGKTYHVISDQSQTSSSVAGGLCNPVILKRLKLPWRVKEQLEIALPYYQLLEKKLQTELIHELTVCRRFYSVEEQNLWFEAADKIGVGTFLSPVVHQNENKFIDAPFGYGKVLNTYRVDTKKLVTAYSDFLQKRNCLTKEQFLLYTWQLTLFRMVITKQEILFFVRVLECERIRYSNIFPLTVPKVNM